MYVEKQEYYNDITGEVSYNPFIQDYENVHSQKCIVKRIRVVKTHTKKEKYISHMKAVVCGNIIHFKTYEDANFYGFEQKGTKSGKKKADKKTDVNINRAKFRLRDLINSNVDQGSSADCFLTFTYKENMTDIDQGKNDFKNFIKRWNYERKLQGLKALKYVYVVEFQKRGAVHFHCIFFDLEYTKVKEISRLWRTGDGVHGSVKINKIDNVDNVGAYVVKYMQKDLLDDRLNGKDLYGRSRGNLQEPVEITKQEIVADLLQMYRKKIVFAKSYNTDYKGKMEYIQVNLRR